MDKLKKMLNDIYTIYNLKILIISIYQNLDDKNQLNDCICQIEDIYRKYNVNDIDDLISLVSEYSKQVQIVKDKELIKLLIFLILNSKERKIINYDDSVLKELYKFIIKNNLYDPNWNIGVSSEPLFVLLPNSSDLYDVNMLVFNNEIIDWNILNNGTDSFTSFVYGYLNSNSEHERYYFLEIIKSALNRVDFDSTKRYKSSQKKVCYEVKPIRQVLIELSEQNDTINPILDLIEQKDNSKKLQYHNNASK